MVIIMEFHLRLTTQVNHLIVDIAQVPHAILPIMIPIITIHIMEVTQLKFHI
jgi:hypothetical protein